MKQVVRAFLKNDEGKYLLVKHQGKNYWSLPGGHVEVGETIYQAIKREIKEELSLKIILTGRKLGLEIESIKEKPQPFCSYKIEYCDMKQKKVKRFEYIFLCTIKSGEIVKQESEIEEYRFFTKEEIIELNNTHQQVKKIAKFL